MDEERIPPLVQLAANFIRNGDQHLLMAAEHGRDLCQRSGSLPVEATTSVIAAFSDGAPCTWFSLLQQRASLVFVSIHWGNELMEWPSDLQRREATWLIGQGADLILGHHPHVIQRPECVSGRPVFFSLGNHLFDQASPKTKEGIIADCRIRGGRLHSQAIRTHTELGTTAPNALATFVHFGRHRAERTTMFAFNSPLNSVKDAVPRIG
jgi:hypothetical protein